MEIDTRFPVKLNTVSDAPEPLRSVLTQGLPSGEPTQLLVHAPAFRTEETSAATVLALTSNRWLLASEVNEGRATLQESGFNDTLFVELKMILLLGQLRISFAAVDRASSVSIKFETVGEELYREAIDLILAGIDPALTSESDTDRISAPAFRDWPLKTRNEAQRYCPRGQPLLGAAEWHPVYGESRQELVSGGALLVTAGELVVISEDKKALEEPLTEEAEKPKETLGEIVTFIPRSRLADFQVTQQEGRDILTLDLRAARGGEKLEVRFPSDQETAVSQAMKRMMLSRAASTKSTPGGDK